ncbi:AI-2E family transporter [Nemorincola caseinilytica]|uniref:AI-2E family transporter n=1 Tax=Nemorincola caseinilytica TaxID=2054315 RepID=A0ABP8N938_9BACT
MKEMPLTVRRSIEALGICAAGAIVVLGQSVIMPLLMAFFISLLLLPVLRWFTARKVPEIIAICLCILLFVVVIAGIATLLSIQIAGFLSDLDTIRKNLTLHWNKLSTWISTHAHVSVTQQMAMIKKQGAGLGNNVSGYFSTAFASLSNIFVFLGLIPIYVFLILFYRNLLVRFVYLWFEEPQHPRVEEAARETEVIVKYYLIGLLIQIAYLIVLLGGILLLFGIKHAILIGITFAILNLIPYLGALIGNLIGVLLTLTTSQEMWQIWAVLGTIAFVQFLDNNILMPRIVGSKVKVNALVSIIGIVIGGTMAGISGMFLSIPVMAVLKIVFDRSSNLKQWGYLLGDTRPALSPISNRMYRIKRDLEQKRDESVEDKKDEATDEK